MEYRRHTSKLDYDELLVAAGDAFGGVLKKAGELDRWQRKLNEFPFWHEIDKKCLVYDAMEKGILPPSKFHSFADAYNEEVREAKGRESLYQYHGAMTRMLRDNSLFRIADRTPVLNGICDEYMELVAA